MPGTQCHVCICWPLLPTSVLRLWTAIVCEPGLCCVHGRGL